MNSPAPALSPPAEPYRGLEPYRYADRAIFFERDSEAEQLVQLVTIYRGSLLYGQSGAGKSSLINAGFLPKVIEMDWTAERIRVQPKPGKEFVVERIPVGSPDGARLPSFLTDAPAGAVLSASDFAKRLESVRCASRPLLIFDQFEELLTLTDDQVGGVGENDAVQSQDTIRRTLAELLENQRRFQARFLFVFREDYLAQFDEFFLLRPELPDHFLRLKPPTPTSLGPIIRGPFEARNIPAGHWKKTIDATVAADLEKQLRAVAAGVNLSQVQIAALQLWRSDDPAEALARLGVPGLIEGYLHEALAGLSARRAVSETLLSLMITKQGTRKISEESELLDEIQRQDGIKAGEAKDALGELVSRAHLVRRDYYRGAPTYEILSEFLAPWIRDLKLRLDARRARAKWIQRGVLTLVICAIALGAAAYVQFQKNTKDKLVAKAIQDTAELRDLLAKQGTDRERGYLTLLEKRDADLEEQRRHAAAELQAVRKAASEDGARALTAQRMSFESERANLKVEKELAEKKAADLNLQVAALRREISDLKAVTTAPSEPANTDKQPKDDRSKDDGKPVQPEAVASKSIEVRLLDHNLQTVMASGAVDLTLGSKAIAVRVPVVRGMGRFPQNPALSDAKDIQQVKAGPCAFGAQPYYDPNRLALDVICLMPPGLAWAILLPQPVPLDLARRLEPPPEIQRTIELWPGNQWSGKSNVVGANLLLTRAKMMKQEGWHPGTSLWDEVALVAETKSDSVLVLWKGEPPAAWLHVNVPIPHKPGDFIFSIRTPVARVASWQQMSRSVLLEIWFLHQNINHTENWFSQIRLAESGAPGLPSLPPLASRMKDSERRVAQLHQRLVFHEHLDPGFKLLRP